MPPYAAAVILREFGPGLEAQAAGMAASGSESGVQAAWELRVALGQMRESVRQLQERRREMPGPAPTSASGSAEVVGLGSAAGSEMSSSEVAVRLGVSDRWVRQLCGSGCLAATRRGRVWCVTQQALDDYMDGLEVAG